jgi:hypothetical protein
MLQSKRRLTSEILKIVFKKEEAPLRKYVQCSRKIQMEDKMIWRALREPILKLTWKLNTGITQLYERQELRKREIFPFT